MELSCRGHQSCKSFKKLCFLPFKKRHILKWSVCLIQAICLINNYPKWISSLYKCATYFELTIPVVQNICDKKTI